MGHIPLKGCTLESETAKTEKYPNCFRLYSKTLDKSYYLQAADYADMLQWVSAIKAASESICTTGKAVPANTAPRTGNAGHERFQNEDEFPMTEEAVPSHTTTGSYHHQSRVGTDLPVDASSERSTRRETDGLASDSSE